MRVFLAALLLMMGTWPALAQQGVTVEMAEDHVDITTGFNGSTLSLFGVKSGSGQVAVVVRGPEHHMTVRRKQRIAGMWLNRTGITFQNMPVYYNYATSAPEDEMARPDVLIENGIGLASLPAKTNSWAGRQQQQDFHAALVRNKQKSGHYAEKAGVVKPISDNFFRANFYLPHSVIPGVYEIKTYYFLNGSVRDIKTERVRVGHVGASANILRFAEKHSFSYAMLCIALAVFAGWLSNRLRRAR